jgi:hypothetical protein
MDWLEKVVRIRKRGMFVLWLLVGKPEGKRPLGRPIRRWVDNIKMDLVGIGMGGVDWIGLAEDKEKLRALVNVVMNLRVPLCLRNYRVAT